MWGRAGGELHARGALLQDQLPCSPHCALRMQLVRACVRPDVLTKSSGTAKAQIDLVRAQAPPNSPRVPTGLASYR